MPVVEMYRNPDLLWKPLQFVVGTEEDVQIRREVVALYMHTLCDDNTCDYTSGSKGEGFLLSWSDVDIMVSLPTLNISMEARHNDCEFIAFRYGCQPGFCKLLHSNKSTQYLFSRIMFLQERQKINYNKNFDLTNRGPSFSTKYPGGFDRCYAFPLHPDSSNTFLKKNSDKILEQCKIEDN